MENQIRLETVIDIDSQVEAFRTNKLEVIKPEILYGKNHLLSKTQLYQHYREESICVVNEIDNVLLDLISDESYRKIARQKLCRIHLGLIVIGMKGLTRAGLGAKVLVCILDTRHTNDVQALIGSMEIDMNNNQAIIYCAPDFLINTGSCATGLISDPSPSSPSHKPVAKLPHSQPSYNLYPTSPITNPGWVRINLNPNLKIVPLFSSCTVL